MSGQGPTLHERGLFLPQLNEVAQLTGGAGREPIMPYSSYTPSMVDWKVMRSFAGVTPPAVTEGEKSKVLRFRVARLFTDLKYARACGLGDDDIMRLASKCLPPAALANAVKQVRAKRGLQPAEVTTDGPKGAVGAAQNMIAECRWAMVPNGVRSAPGGTFSGGAGVVLEGPPGSDWTIEGPGECAESVRHAWCIAATYGGSRLLSVLGSRLATVGIMLRKKVVALHAGPAPEEGVIATEQKPRGLETTEVTLPGGNCGQVVAFSKPSVHATVEHVGDEVDYVGTLQVVDRLSISGVALLATGEHALLGAQPDIRVPVVEETVRVVRTLGPDLHVYAQGKVSSLKRGGGVMRIERGSVFPGLSGSAVVGRDGALVGFHEGLLSDGFSTFVSVTDVLLNVFCGSKQDEPWAPRRRVPSDSGYSTESVIDTGQPEARVSDFINGHAGEAVCLLGSEKDLLLRSGSFYEMLVKVGMNRIGLIVLAEQEKSGMSAASSQADMQRRNRERTASLRVGCLRYWPVGEPLTDKALNKLARAMMGLVAAFGSERAIERMAQALCV